jgi:hypothetical protein
MKVFLSSTYIDLIYYRKAAIEALERLDQQIVRMEVFGARPEEPYNACLFEIESCDLFVGIYAHRYGYIPSGFSCSITEEEFNHAKKLGKPIFCFFVDEDYPWLPPMIEEQPGKTKLQSFKARIGSEIVRDIFTTPEDLAVKVATAVGRYLSHANPTKENNSPSVDRIREVLAACYRRAIFTRTHSQLNLNAMFDSLANCRSILQRVVAFVEPESLQQLVVQIIGDLDYIERHKKKHQLIDTAKLKIIAALLQLSKAANVSYILPASLTEELFRKREDADGGPKIQSAKLSRVKEPEIELRYPYEWVEEFRTTGKVKCWLDNCPDLFDGRRGTLKLSPDNMKSNLSTYALMYLLKRNESIESLTYFRLAAKTKTIDGRREALQEHLRTWMGNESFEKLRTAIREAKLKGFQGEPDLFCWNHTNREWFFAEAKGDDRLTDTQRRWFAVCRATLPGVSIKLYRVRPLLPSYLNAITHQKSGGTSD